MTISREKVMTPNTKDLFQKYNNTEDKESFLKYLQDIENTVYNEDDFGFNLIFLKTYFDLFAESIKEDNYKEVEKYYRILVIENFVDFVFSTHNISEKRTLELEFSSKKDLTTKIERMYKIYLGENLF